MKRRTKSEQRAFLDGYEMCGKCIETYLSKDGKERLNSLLIAVRNAVDIEDLPDDSAEGESKVLEDIKAENLCDSCVNTACEFQSGIRRSSCAFYMPPN